MAVGGLESSVPHDLIDAAGAELGTAIPHFRRGPIPQSFPHISSHHGVHNSAGIRQRVFPGFPASVFASGPTIQQSDRCIC